MSKRDWGFYAVFGLIVVVSIGMMSAGIWLEPQCAANQSFWSDQQENNESEDWPERRSHISCGPNCKITLGVSEEDKADDANSVAKRYSDPGQQASLPPVEERDLCQQARMAWWTRIIAYFTAVGAFLLFWTLMLTRRDIEETLAIGKRQSRAYVSVAESSVVTFRAGQSFHAKVILKNTGQTPAKDFCVSATTAYVRIPTTRDLLDEAPSPTITSPRITIGASGTVNLDCTHNERLDFPDIALVQNGLAAFVVTIIFQYVDIFDETQNESIQLISIGEKSREGKGLSGFSPDRIMLPQKKDESGKSPKA